MIDRHEALTEAVLSGLSDRHEALTEALLSGLTDRRRKANSLRLTDERQCGFGLSVYSVTPLLKKLYCRLHFASTSEISVIDNFV